MHIIIDCTSTQDQLQFSGIGMFTRNLVLELVKQNQDDKFSLLLFKAHSTLDKYNLQQYKNVEIENIGKLRISNFLNYLWYKVQIEPVIKRISTKESIFFTSYFWRYFPGKWMKTVVHIQDFALPKLDVYSDKNRIFDRIRKLQYWHALNKVKDVNFVTVNLEHTRQEYLSYFPEYDANKVQPLELGIDIEFSESEVNQEEILEKYMIAKNDWKDRGYIIYLGGDIVKTKNSEAVIEGYSKFTKLYKYKYKKNNYPYLLVAGKEFTNLSRKKAIEFQQLVKNLNLTDDVVYTNFYENTEKYTLLSNAKCFVHLSKYEGFGLALLEAMLSKVPIVVSNIFPYKYILENDDYLVDPDNYSEIGNTIFDVVINNSYQNELIEKRFIRAKKFTWANTAKDLMEVFRKV